MKKLIAGAIVVLAVCAIAGTAGAATQTITANLTNSVSMTADPTSTISSWVLAASGANTVSGGSMTVSANSPYTVTVSADKTRLSEWDGSAYVTNGKTLTNPLVITPTRSGGTAPTAATASAATIGTSSTLAVGTGLGTDTFDLSLGQTTAIGDSALADPNTYHIVLTYTASSTL